MAGWWEWGQHKDNKRQQKHERYLRSRDYGLTQIEWNLSKELMPVTVKESQYWNGKRKYKWYTNNSPDKSVSFVYILKEKETNAVRYVGLTDDPPRRYSEHYKNNMLRCEFIMSVIEAGDRTKEKEHIQFFIDSGCELLNQQGI